MTFMELGSKVDNLIASIQMLNIKMPWYKIYAYFYVKRRIKAKEFKGDWHFERFMDMAKCHLWDWQCKRLRKLYVCNTGNGGAR